MLFKRRDKPGIFRTFRAWMWPQRGWKRAGTYVWHRVTRLSGSSHAIALGFAAGAFASFTPFMGLHFLIGALLALVIGGNLLASALGTFVGNPVSFPFIWFLTYSFGNYLLGVDTGQPVEVEMPRVSILAAIADPAKLWTEFVQVAWPLIKPMTVGGVPLGILAGSICYFPVKLAVESYKHRRQEKLRRSGRAKEGKTGKRAAHADVPIP